MKKFDTRRNHNDNLRPIFPLHWNKMYLPYNPKLTRHLNADSENC